MKRVVAVLFGLSLFASLSAAAEKGLMHCFAFTPVENATAADFQEFFKATDALPGKIPGLTHVWAGKLARPLRVGDAVRQYGVCMEFKDEAALKSYAENPAHTAWVKVYDKVRAHPTTTFDIIPQ